MNLNHHQRVVLLRRRNDVREKLRALTNELDALNAVLQDRQTDLLATPVSNLELSTRVWNCFGNEGISTVGDIVAHSSKELLRVHMFGRKSLREVEGILQDLGLSLRAG